MRGIYIDIGGIKYDDGKEMHVMKGILIIMCNFSNDVINKGDIYVIRRYFGFCSNTHITWSHSHLASQ